MLPNTGTLPMGDINVWKKLEEDEFLRVFIDGDFDVKSHAQHMAKGIAVPDQISKLSEGIALLDQELKYQIMNHYEDLLSHATWVEKLEGVLIVMQSHMQNLLSSIERLRAQVLEPYRRVEIQTLVLGRLQETCDTIRRIFRALLLSRRLQAHVSCGTPELIRAAQCLGEIEQVWGETDLTGIDIVEKQQRAVRVYKADIERQAKFMLVQGLKAQNESQVSMALEVHAHLGQLGASLQQAAEGARQKTAAAIRDNLDVRNFTQPASLSSQSDSNSRASKGGPGRAMMSAAGNVSVFRASLWSSLEKMLLESIYGQCCQIALLHRCGMSATSSLSRSGRLKEKPPTPCTLEDYWNYVSSLLTRELTSAAKSSTFIKQALENEYPKFLRLYLDLWRRLSSLYKMNDSSHNYHKNMLSSRDSFGADMNGLELKREVVEPFETAYLTSSMSRLYDPVEGMFVGDGGTSGSKGSVTVLRSGTSGNNGVSGSGPGAETLAGEATHVPAQDKLDLFVRTITRELSVSLVDTVLSRKVARNVKNALKLFCVKCEQTAAHDASSTQVIEAFTPSQNLNATLVNILCYLNGEVSRAIVNIGGPSIAATSTALTVPASSSTLSEEASSLVLGALTDSRTLAAGILQPLLDSVSEAIKAILYTMHNEDFSGEAVPDKKRTSFGASPYMKELQRFLSRVASDYLSKYNCQELMISCVVPVVERCLELFMRHACLIRPIGAGGRAKLASDFVQVEIAVEPLLSGDFESQRGDLASIESNYAHIFHTLRSLRPILLTTEMPTVEELTNPDSPVPPSLVMFSLFARGPPELLSPHQSMNWSIERLSRWLDTHKSEKERLEIARGSLERYESEVRLRGEKHFHPAHPVMVSVLREGVARANL